MRATAQLTLDLSPLTAGHATHYAPATAGFRRASVPSVLLGAGPSSPRSRYTDTQHTLITHKHTHSQSSVGNINAQL